MNNHVILSHYGWSRDAELQCPYFDVSDRCNAALSALLPSQRMRTDLCGNEDFGNCPIFLAKILRRR
ncbi:MAG TPA: hypothetical protein VEI46_11370 [Thermodesulfovibrionales bacterium]|nr:hypothetical protein [Thermodesulfovibrionales bacterium]